MKKELKGFVVGVVLSSLVVSALPTMAEKITKSAELLYNDIKVVIDGKRADLKDANGNTVEPFIVDGTTYLPVRAVANALDKAVSWDGATQTVYLGKNDEIEQPSVWLKDLETFTGNAQILSIDNIEFGGEKYNDVLTDNSGNVYKNCIQADEISYLLNNKYDIFKGIIYLENGNKSTYMVDRWLVFGDDKILFTSNDVQKGFFPQDFSVNVSNVSVLKIIHQYKVGENYSTSSGSISQIGNAGLYE